MPLAARADLTFAFLSVNSVAMEISGQRQGAVTETDARLPEVLLISQLNR